MAAGGSRTLKLSILGDIDNLKKSLTQGTTEVSTFGDKITKFGKIAGAAFLAAGVAAAAYAGKLLIDGVKSAIEDEAAQAKLATTLQNVTNATDAQVAAIESQILKTSLLTGKTDNELRPSFERFLRATKDSEEALKLQQVALDVAAGSGKSLEAVTNAMSKAAEGNAGSLAKLGVGLTAAQLKTMSLDEITKSLATTLAGQATVQADTFSGKMARLKVAIDEGKETVGSFLLDAITPMINTLVEKVIPAVSGFIESIGGKEGLTNTFMNYIDLIKSIFLPVLDGFKFAFNQIKDSVMDNKEEFTALFKFLKDFVAPFMGGVFKLAIQGIGIALGVIIDVVALLIKGFQTLFGIINSVVDAIQRVIALVASNPIVRGISGAISSAFGGGRAAGGLVMAGTSYLVGERGAELFTPSSNGNITPNNKMGGTVINLNVTGAIDPEGTARSIISALNNSYYRGTNGANALVFS